MENTHILPDSRLASPQQGVMANWQLPNGSSVRLECEMIYCANCGIAYGYVPKENTTFACFLCQQCFETYGSVAGTYAIPDEEFNQNVAHEIEERFQRPMSTEDLLIEAQNGRLGTALEKLAMESPYPVYD